MKAVGKFILLDLEEFSEWLSMQIISREIKRIQHHHTYIPDYSYFNGENHFKLCQSMENEHIKRGFNEIGQNFTTFPDGRIMVCRSINTTPAGIKGANERAICIENVGNFDIGHDIMTNKQKDCIISLTKTLLDFFNIVKSDETILYHHWYDLTLGTRIAVGATGDTKSCPGTNFFNGNTVVSFNQNFLPLV